jgi:fibronectin-binding autotransporter adhesin
MASISATALTALSAGSAAAQNWTGTTSTDWTAGTNWSGGAVPIAGNVNINTTSPNPTVLGVGGAAAGTTGNIVVGGTAGSTGNLTIQNGSTLTSSGATLHIGSQAGSTGTMTVTGPGSQWTTSGSVLIIGQSGTGTLNILNGAHVIAQNGVRLGGLGGSSGTLNISGGSLLETTTLSTGAGTRELNFDNAIVRALGNGVSFIGGGVTQLNIAAGGLTVDSAGFTIGSLGFSGVGGLTKIGAGTFSLRATSTYTGPTVIEVGTLALVTAGSVAASSRVVANGTFDISGIAAAGSNIQSLAGSGVVTLGTKNLTITNANDTFAGIISGNGGLTVSGGMQTLSGSNTYAGGTTISAGTLQLGNGGTSGSIIGNVTNNATLAFNRSDAATFTGIVSGSGSVSQVGTGTTILTAANSYTGGTAVNGGTLQISADNNLGAAAGGLSFNGGRLRTTADIATARAVALNGAGHIRDAHRHHADHARRDLRQRSPRQSRRQHDDPGRRQ